MRPVLVADSVGKSFGGQRVLSSATLRAVPGQVRVLFGTNGVGKSTLLKIACGAMSADSGVIQFRNRVLQSPRLHKLAAEGLFYLPDHDLFSRAFTVRHQLEMIRCRFDGRDVDEAAQRLGIVDHIDKRPHQLSGGERRRAELAAVVVRRPICLLADEPYRGIPPLDAEVMTSTLVELARSGVAVVITGHEVPTLLDAADHVSWCTSGTTYELGSPYAAQQHHAFRRDYLGMWGKAKAV
ncbi:MAG TPA: ATP-binding cassette domain-containing protein [Gemmatimonadaceae bacterium]|jgi:ABC-type multidrug transport system ATPase subunit|nr:ATP-binding cassette domain-containing protein [Gemmatimonadaceae bacterium]